MAAFPSRTRVVFRCEACGGVLIKRTSYLSHPHLRHDTYVCCDNPVCSASYTGHTEPTGIASPSGMPYARPSELPPAPGYPRAVALRVPRRPGRAAARPSGRPARPTFLRPHALEPQHGGATVDALPLPVGRPRPGDGMRPDNGWATVQMPTYVTSAPHQKATYVDPALKAREAETLRAELEAFLRACGQIDLADKSARRRGRKG